MIKFDMQRLKEDADCRDVARYIGMRLNGRYCECVSGLHSETQLNHCAIYEKSIHCFSCGDNQDVFGMVKEYYANVLGTPISLREACTIIGNSLGGAELYTLSGKQAEYVERPPFDSSDIKLLKLDAQPKDANAIPVSINRIYRADKKLYYRMIRTRAREMAQKYEMLSRSLGKSPLEAKLRIEISQRLERLEEIRQEAGGTERTVRPLFKL